MKTRHVILGGITLYLLMLAVFGPNTRTETTPPTPTTRTISTVVIRPLDPVQETERIAEIVAGTTTTTTTEPPIAIVYPDTPCQEWADDAVNAGWPADIEVIDKLMRIIYKESRCINITPLSPDPNVAAMFNGHDHSLIQANEIHTAWVEELFGEPFAVAMSNPDHALRFAYLLYSAREEQGECGWQPWSVTCG